MILINIFGLQNKYYFWCLKHCLYLKKYVGNFHEINSGFVCEFVILDNTVSFTLDKITIFIKRYFYGSKNNEILIGKLYFLCSISSKLI